jgi:hypothetical protein
MARACSWHDNYTIRRAGVTPFPALSGLDEGEQILVNLVLHRRT